MNVRFMQRIDVALGVPLCWALSGLNRIRSLFSKGRPPKPPARVLCIELSEIGSTVLAHSALELLKERTGGDIYFLTFRKNAAAVELLGVLPRENVIVIDDDSFGRFTASAIAALGRIRRLKIDAAIDLELFSRFTMMFSYLTGARARAGFSNYTNEGLYRGNLLTHPVFYNPHQHMALNILALVASLLDAGSMDGSERPLVKADMRPFLLSPPRMPIPAEETNEIARLLAAKLPEYNPASLLVLLSPDPGPAIPLRGWPIASFIQLIGDLLAHSPRILIGLTGLKSSQPIAREILAALAPAQAARVADFTGETSSMTALLALFRASHLLISNDGGSAHLASLTGLPMIVLFGPETPALYAPLGEGVTSMFAGLSCSPCLSAANHRHSVCTNNRCLQAITPESVLAEALQKLDGR